MVEITTLVFKFFVSLAVGVLMGIVLIIIGLPSLRILFRIFGAEANVLEFGISYMTIILLGAVFMFSAYICNGIFSSQGNLV